MPSPRSRSTVVLTSAVSALVLASATACGGSAAAGGGPKGDVLRVATQQMPVQLDSCGPSNGSELAYKNIIYAPLIKADPKTGKLGPGLASSWKYSDDLLSMSLTLKPGLTFQDGTALNAESVAKSLQQCQKMGNQVPEVVKSITAQDATTVVFTFNSPYAVLPELLSGTMGMVASPTAREKEGDKFASAPVGAGPYKLTEYKPGDSAVFERWDSYTPAGTPAGKVGTIQWRILSDNSAMESEIEAGNVDFAWGFNTSLVEPLKDVPGLSQGFNEPGAGWTSINLNRSKAPLNDVRVRQAISYAIDRKAMASAVSAGVWTEPTWGPYPSASPFYDPSVDNAQPYNVDKAKELLKEAGYPNGLTIKGVSLDAFPYADNGVVLKDQLAKAGIKLDVAAEPTAQATQDYYPGTDNLMLISAMGGTSPIYNYQQFYGQDSTANVGQVPTAETKLVNKLLTTVDQDKQRDLELQINKIAADDVPFIGLYFMPNTMAWSKNVTGAEDTKNTAGNVNLAYLGLSK